MHRHRHTAGIYSFESWRKVRTYYINKVKNLKSENFIEKNHYKLIFNKMSTYDSKLKFVYFYKLYFP